MGLKEMANRFVRNREQGHLEDLAYRAVDTVHRAEGCGCLQCKKIATGAQDRFAKENARLNTWTLDQEEEEIMNWAINNRLLKSSDE